MRANIGNTGRLIGLVLLAASCVSVLGADTKQFDPSQNSQLITVVSTSGTIKGTLTSYDPDGVTIQPAPKPVPKNKPQEPASQPAPVTFKWSDIKSISDGLSQRKALDAFEASHKADLCPTCKGERRVFCTVCKGTGHDPAAHKDCKVCNGELLVDCKTPGCKNGEIPCPNLCLRLGVGHWVKHDDGLQWCLFHIGRGTAMYSEHHLGHLIVVDRVNMQVNDDGVCPVCGGTTTVTDPACLGTGKMPCPAVIKGAGPCPGNCEHGFVVCPDCGGTGLKKAT